MPGVTVTATNVATSLVRSTVTGPEGRYVLVGLPPGTYDLTAELTGFKPHVRRGVVLPIATTIVVNVTLQLGGVEIRDEVVAGSSLVNTSTSELSYLVGSETIELLPLNGRNYTDLALLQPGVLAYPHRDGGSVVAHGLGMSINGQDPRSNVYLLDGTIQNDFTNGPAGSAAGTALGMETVREFRVETNAYSAEFGRNSGGQINVLTKSGSNRYSGSAYEYHRNDAFDAPNYFDSLGKPDFTRNQFGGSVGGPIETNRAFFFFGYEALVERLGRTVSTVVPDDNARLGILPSGVVGVNPAVAPYLDEYPRANGDNLGQGLAVYNFPFDQRLDQSFVQGRVDYNTDSRQFFARYTFDNTTQYLPTDYPQFPRTFFSRNQFFTGEYREVLSPRTLNTARIGFSRTRIGQNVEANTSQPLAPFVPGRELMGSIDVGGMRRFGTQSSANLRLVQNVFAFQDDLVHVRGRHVMKAGALVEHYQDNMVNPTFSLGIYAFPNLSAFLRNAPNNFIGLTPEAQFDRYWRFTLFGFYFQDDYQLSPRISLNGGLRYEFSTMPQDIYGRDSALPDLTASAPVVGPLYENPTYTNLSPRVGFAWDATGDGKTSVRGGYGLYFNTNNHQNLIVTVTNPPATPRPVIVNPSFPTPDFNRAGAISMRPVQYDLDNPRVHVFNFNVQRELWWRTALMLGYAGSRGQHLLRSGDVNTAQPIIQADGTVFIPAGHAAAEHGVLDHRAQEQRRRILVQRAHRRRPAPPERRRLAAVVVYLLEEHRHDAGVDLLLRRQQRHDLGDARVHRRLQQGTVGLRHAPQLGREPDLGAADAVGGAGAARRLAHVGDLDDAERPAAHGVRDREPLAVAVEPVAGARHRPGPSELRPRLRARQRHQRHAPAVVQPGSVRAAAGRHVRQHRPGRPRRP